MRPFYNEIRNLISRAEYDINPYSGFLRRKRMIYNKGNGNFDGKNIKITLFINSNYSRLFN